MKPVIQVSSGNRTLIATKSRDGSDSHTRSAGTKFSTELFRKRTNNDRKRIEAMITSCPNEKEKDRKLYFLVKFEWWPEEFGRHRASLSFQPDDMWEAALSWVAVSHFLKISCSTAGFGVEENASVALLRRASGRVMTAHRGGSVMFGDTISQIGRSEFFVLPCCQLSLTIMRILEEQLTFKPELSSISARRTPDGIHDCSSQPKAWVICLRAAWQETLLTSML